MTIAQISEEHLKQHEFIAVRNEGEVECLLSFDEPDGDEPYSVCESPRSGEPCIGFFVTLEEAKAFAQEIGWGADEFNALP